jgi:hypothetical protein
MAASADPWDDIFDENGEVFYNLMVDPQPGQAPASDLPSQEDYLNGDNTAIVDIDAGGLAAEDCTICQDPYTSDKPEEQLKKDSDHSVMRLVSCGHHFHRLCVLLWLKEHNTCPMCRKQQYAVGPRAPFSQ